MQAIGPWPPDETLAQNCAVDQGVCMWQHLGF